MIKLVILIFNSRLDELKLGLLQSDLQPTLI